MSNIVLFEEKNIRRTWHNDQWFFSVIDIIEVLTNTTNPTSYWSKVQKSILAENEFVRFWHKLKLQGKDGKMYPSDCANTEGVLRIIMSVPSPKAEPFKLWMAQVSNERINEIEDPELTLDRAVLAYKAKGYPDEWIATRLKSIDIRNQLTDQWKIGGVQEGSEYSILTAEIAQATFGITPAKHKDLKRLQSKDNLRDHMTNLELIFTMLGEEVTRGLAEDTNAQGFSANREVAIQGGEAAGEARTRLEKKVGKKVISPKNFKNLEDPNSILESPTE